MSMQYINKLEPKKNISTGAQLPQGKQKAQNMMINGMFWDYYQYNGLVFNPKRNHNNKKYKYGLQKKIYHVFEEMMKLPKKYSEERNKTG